MEWNGAKEGSGNTIQICSNLRCILPKLNHVGYFRVHLYVYVYALYVYARPLNFPCINNPVGPQSQSFIHNRPARSFVGSGNFLRLSADILTGKLVPSQLFNFKHPLAARPLRLVNRR